MNIVEKDRKYVWHPFTQMKTAGDPLHIERAKGIYLYDDNGNAIIDAVSSWWVNLHGHGHPYIAGAIKEQALNLEHVIFAGFTHTPAVTIAERLLSYLPHQSKVFFSDDGSTAVEVALKMCIQYFHNQDIPRRRIIALEEAYHGDTFGAMSAGGDCGFNGPFNDYFFQVEHIPAPIPGSEEASLTALRKELDKGDVCCFIFEPLIQGSGGMRMYSPEILDKMIGMVHEAGALCIADEVMTGFYRTGKMFASDYLTNKPDCMALSKGLTGGTLALSITTCTEKIYEAFLSDDKSKTFFHGHSFTANPIGCAAAIASLDLLEKEECQSNIRMIVEMHSEFLKELEAHPKATNARQRGTIIAFEFETGKETSYFNSIRDTLYHFFLERGVLLRPLGNVVYIMAPYVISKEELEKIYGLIREALDSI